MTQVSMVKINKKAKKAYPREVFQRGFFGMLMVVAGISGVVTGGFFFPAARTASSLEPVQVPQVSDISIEEPVSTLSEQVTAVLFPTDPSGQEPISAPLTGQVAGASDAEPDSALGGLAEVVLTPADISLIVLNGSGVEGEAGRFAEYAEAKGFTNVDTANAKRWDYEETEIYFSEENAEKAKQVMEILGQKYSWIMYAEALDDKDADVVIVLGKTSPMQEL